MVRAIAIAQRTWSDLDSQWLAAKFQGYVTVCSSAIDSSACGVAEPGSRRVVPMPSSGV
jgi:hypothetical protein